MSLKISNVSIFYQTQIAGDQSSYFRIVSTRLLVFYRSTCLSFKSYNLSVIAHKTNKRDLPLPDIIIVDIMGAFDSDVRN